MRGICCICREKIGVEKLAAGRVVTSFRLQRYGLCPACQGKTQADIARAYGHAAVTAAKPGARGNGPG